MRFPGSVAQAMKRSEEGGAERVTPRKRAGRQAKPSKLFNPPALRERGRQRS